LWTTTIYRPRTAGQAISRSSDRSRLRWPIGNWLSLRQPRALLNAPDTSRKRGFGGPAVLAILLGCGFGRFEVAALGPCLRLEELRKAVPSRRRRVAADLVAGMRLADSQVVPRGQTGLGSRAERQDQAQSCSLRALVRPEIPLTSRHRSFNRAGKEDMRC
jgi:hypothetical protein